MIDFFNLFEVPADREDEFLQLWTEVNHYMITKDGYVSHRLHMSVDASAQFRFVNHGVWQSADHWRAAHDQGSRTLLSQPEWAQFTSTPGLYEVVHSGHSAGIDQDPADGA